VRIIFARHGQSTANVDHVISNRDLPHGLTALGREQAHLLGERIRGEGIGAIHCSPIPRAQETAAIVGASLGLTPVVADGLREPDRGVLEGRGDADAWRLHDALTRRWLCDRDLAARTEGGESLGEVRDRFEAFLASLPQRHGDADTVLGITHGALLLTVLPLVVRDVPTAATASGSIGHAATVLALHGAGVWRCVDWRDTPDAGG
jgi:broad specificity phosphatase PhoE